MAADSSSDESEAAPPVPIDEKPSPARETPGGPARPPPRPPRPPRPAKRAPGSVRIPLPSAVAAGPNGAARVEAPATRLPTPPSSAPAVALSSASLATPVPMARAGSTRPPPAVVTPAVTGEPAGNIEFHLTRRSSAAPPLSFDSVEVDPSDRAPGAPFTPWRDVPRTREPAAIESMPPATAKQAHDHEETIVGQVAKDLLDQSSEDEDEEENTQAYQAPQELIELARREREEQRQAQAGSGRKRNAQAKFHDSLPPTARRAPDDDDDQSDINTATVPIVTTPVGDAAPPVELSRPARGSAAPGAGQFRGRGGAPSLSELAREISDRRIPGSMPPGNEGGGRSDAASAPLSSIVNYRTPWFTRGRLWALLVAVFIAVGYALARWRGLDL